MNELCGCCEGIERLTPIAIVNRPGLDALVYRVGTHASFLETMLARLSASDFPELRGLTIRTADDPSIALLDAWATVADVLTFYQERIANEGYLRTATERRSILELARLVGYKLRPGVAASVYLAYTLEKDPDVVILPGNRAQSVPGPGELPQSFETAETLEARFAWNVLKPRVTRPQHITQDDTNKQKIHAATKDGEIYFQGTVTNLKPGDALLFVFGTKTDQQVFSRVVTVETQAADNRTTVTVDPKPLPQGSAIRTSAAILQRGQGNFESLVESLSKPLTQQPANSQRLQRNVVDTFTLRGDALPQLLTKVLPTLSAVFYPALENITFSKLQIPEVYALRVTASLFGYNAPRKSHFDPTNHQLVDDGDWPILEPGDPDTGGVFSHEKANTVYLDGAYSKIVPDSWFVVETAQTKLTSKEILVAKARNPNAAAGRAEYGITGKATRIELAQPSDTSKDETWLDLTNKTTGDNDFQAIRRTVVYAQSEQLTLAEEPINESIGFNPSNAEVSKVIELATLEDALQSGRWIIVSGERTDIRLPNGTPVLGVRASELVMLASVTQDVQKLSDGITPLPGDIIHTFLHLVGKGLAYSYKRETVTIYGNVVRATHGETRSETLGSGDGSKVLQQFSLRQFPLTYLAAPTAAGALSTLQVRINDILWHEADSLAGLGPIDRSYTSETDDASKTTVIFGNGQYGARLPTGVENVKAVYRTGIGKPGNVTAEQISLLATKPLGVKSVINPLRASGGADRESRDQARRNVPVALLALDRLVSVQDYADFARTYAGIGKASAVRLSDGRRQLVHLTIVGADNIPIDESSDLFQNLFQSLRQFGDPNEPLTMELAGVMFIVISAKVHLLPDYALEFVEPKIRAALLDFFSFERRELGQPVFQSEVFSVIQSVPGVDFVELEIMDAIDQDRVIKALDTPPGSPQPPGISSLGLGNPSFVDVKLAHVDPNATDP